MRVPAPKVHDVALEHPDNPIGVSYVLMEKLPGKSVRRSVATAEPRRKGMQQLADTSIGLHKCPFHKLGSLDSPGGLHIGTFARASEDQSSINRYVT